MAFHYIGKLFRHPTHLNFTIIKKSLSALYYIPSSIIEKIKLHQLEKA
jgi:hypothetical protein